MVNLIESSSDVRMFALLPLQSLFYYLSRSCVLYIVYIFAMHEFDCKFALFAWSLN